MIYKYDEDYYSICIKNLKLKNKHTLIVSATVHMYVHTRIHRYKITRKNDTHTCIINRAIILNINY